ncbi:hypothetical protein SAMN05519103_04304 [Rhizobiales bacterium GAS113]|nr:hypothetical protein SAMN05519103_04304 [Rhizobiales bacterium GAS113]
MSTPSPKAEPHDRLRSAGMPRLVGAVLIWVAALLLGVAMQLPGASPAAASPSPHAHHHHSHGEVATASPSASGTISAHRLPAQLYWGVKDRGVGVDHASTCPNHCGGECDPGGTCCGAGGVMLLGTADAEIHAVAASALRQSVPQDEMPASGPVYLIPRPPNHVA